MSQGLTEAFTYDNLHRLDLVKLNGVTTLDMVYDALGNITSKSGVGAYSYHATKKHAVLTAGPHTFTYDANGNQITRNGQTVSWYSYNLPNTINGGTGYSSQFFYGPNRNRWKQVANYGGTNETTIYAGGLLEKVTLGSVTSYKHYLSGPTGPIAVVTRKSDGTNDAHYLTKDHLGSIDSISSPTGTLRVALSYDSFGLRRRALGWSGNPTSSNWSQITASSRHGFTEHEHLDNLSLIHMNGRVYDPVVGRFTSADPFIDSWSHTQGFNRYSYVKNSPLTFTDPSGFLKKLFYNGPYDNGLAEVTISGSRGGSRGSGAGSFYGGGGNRGSDGSRGGDKRGENRLGEVLDDIPDDDDGSLDEVVVTAEGLPSPVPIPPGVVSLSFDASNSAPSGEGEDTQGDDTSKQSFMDCLADCIRASDPRNQVSNPNASTLAVGVSFALGAPLPKSLLGYPLGLAGASRYVTPLSVLAHEFLGGGSNPYTLGGVVRTAGRVASGVWIGYGLVMAGVEVACTAHCASQ